MRKLYIIKNIGSWMIDELDVFSEKTSFTLLLLREQPPFYSERLKILENKGVQIVYLNHRVTFNLKKWVFLIQFLFKNGSCFLDKNSAVYGLKACIYFLKIPERIKAKENLSIHAQFATQAAILGFLVKKYQKKQTVELNFTFHAYDIYGNNRWFKTLLENSKQAFSISRYNIDYVISKYKISGEKIRYVPLGVFHPAVFHKKDFTDILHVGFMSYWVEMKGLFYLLEAIKRLNEQNVPVQLHLAGDGPLKEKAFEYIQKNNLSQKVTYYGLVKDEQKKQFFQAIDIFVLPSVALGIATDGLPVVLMEAVSYGIPIISTNVTGIPEICFDAKNGFLINQKSSEEIINSLKIVIKNKELRKGFQKEALDVAMNYNIITNSQKKLELLAWFENS